MFKPLHILHPTDFSSCSTFGFHIAVDLASQNSGKLLVLHIAETLGPENTTYGEAISQIQPQGYQQRLWEELHKIVPPPGQTIPVDYLLIEGDPAKVIVQVATEHHCDLIVLGTQGRTGLQRLLMGSVAEHVVRSAPCPVLTFKCP